MGLTRLVLTPFCHCMTRMSSRTHEENYELKITNEFFSFNFAFLIVNLSLALFW